ncbi:MAG: DUF2799 domain-containing protein [Pikeienuella sp.]
MKALLLSLGAATVLAACASPGPKAESRACSGVDWYAVGVSEGSAGYDDRRLDEHQSHCPSVDAGSWIAGFSEGQTKLCTTEGAYRTGVAGLPYEGLCAQPPEGYEAAYARGTEFGDVTRLINDKRTEIREFQRQINVLKRDLSSVANGASRSSPADRARILLLQDEIRIRRKELAQLQAERSKHSL